MSIESSLFVPNSRNENTNSRLFRIPMQNIRFDVAVGLISLIRNNRIREQHVSTCESRVNYHESRDN